MFTDTYSAHDNRKHYAMNNNQEERVQGLTADSINGALVTSAQVRSLPRTGELARNVAAAYLAVHGWTRAELKLDEYDQLLERVSLDIVGYALLRGLAPAHGRSITVKHWAWFADYVDAAGFCSVLKSCGYQVLDMTAIRSSPEQLVHFSHVDRCDFDGLCERTIFLARQALSSGGFYDGWHAHCDAANLAACVHGLQRLLDSPVTR